MRLSVGSVGGFTQRHKGRHKGTERLFVTSLCLCVLCLCLCVKPAYALCAVLPSNRSIACGRTGAITTKLSFTAFGEPGRLIINVPERTPETPRESIAIGVDFSDSARIASAIP